MKEDENLRDHVKRVNEIANSIVAVSRAMKELEEGRLNQKAVLVLLSHSSGLSQAKIKQVLNGLADLEKVYLKPQEEEK